MYHVFFVEGEGHVPPVDLPLSKSLYGVTLRL